MERTQSTAALAGLAIALAACGHSDDPGGPGPTLTGTVVGSYYRNALVCSDANGNGRCDGAEPQARSDARGAFSLAADASADVIAQIGTDALRVESSDASQAAVASAFMLRTHRRLLAPAGSAAGAGAGASAPIAPVVVSPLTTAVSAEIDAGAEPDAARTRVAARMGVDAPRITSDFNVEPDPLVQGLLRAASRALLPVIQDVATAARAADPQADLRLALRAALAPSTAASRDAVRYAWTQIGADDAPFSKLEITGISAGSLADNPAAAGYANQGATFATALQSPGAQLYATGGLVARAILRADPADPAATACPSAVVDGVARGMSTRARPVAGVLSNGPTYGSPAAVDFPVLTCETALPETVRSVAIAGRPLVVLRADTPVNRVVVIGDTGCRVQGPNAYQAQPNGVPVPGSGAPLQDCTSEAAWPFAKLARTAASFAPDLVIHNGDLHYREGFPEGIERRFGGAANAAAGGTEQDNAAIKARFVAAGILDSITFGWRAWEEDFFKPVGPLLAAAPWAITRGNHELCDRAAQGWFRFLDPRRFPTGEPVYDPAYVRGSAFTVAGHCGQHTDPVVMQLADLQLVLLDVGMLADTPGLSASRGATNGDHVRTARQLDAVAALPVSSDPGRVTWIVSHKPFFAYSGGMANATGTPRSAQARTWQLQKTIQPGTESVAAGNGRLPPNTQMTHAGHIHGFQVLSQPATTGLPLSVLMGTSGDALDGLIEPNTGQPYAQPSFGNDLPASGSGTLPWLTQVIGGVTVPGTAWATSIAQPPQNFSSSPIVNPGRRETAVMNEFSFLVIDRLPAAAGAPNWRLQVFDPDRRLLRTCLTSGKTARCDG